MFRASRACALAAALAASVILADSASAAIVYESATLGSTGLTTGGYTVEFGQFLGSRFSLDSTTDVSSIAAHMEGFSGTTFGAIVSLPAGPSALPTGSPFDPGIVLASGVFAATSPSAEQSLALSVTLAAGHYGVIFGSGLFGASGYAVMPLPGNTGSTDIGAASYFFWNGSDWIDGGFSAVRFVVNGEPSAIPEPAALTLFGMGLAGIAMSRRRRK